VIKMEPIQLDGGVAIGAMVELPQTRHLTIRTSKGDIAAWYMDLPCLPQRRPERHIIAARALDVRGVTDLLAAQVHDCTPAAAERGVVAVMTGREALERMFELDPGTWTGS
jgi:uncharacterized protein YunC (DUF1805 family)